MSKFPVIINDFSGGLATSLKQGIPNSFAYSRHLDFRKDPQGLTVLPAATKESGSIVTGLIVDMIQLPSGLKVAIDKSGGVYTRTTGATWAKNATSLPSTAYGMAYNFQHDTIYVPGTTTMHSISNADGAYGGSLTVNANVFTATQDQASSGGHAQNYTTLAAISEASVDLLSMVPTVEPLYSVKIWIVTKGTGDLVLTMHDAANDVLGTVTIANAALNNGGYNEFVFTTPPRMYVKPNAATYHFHVNHTGGTASTIGTSSTTDFSTTDFSSWSNRFVNPTNGFHPVTEFLQYLCIANERYMAVWEPISQTNPTALEFQQHRLVFPSGSQVTSSCSWNEFLVIGTEKRSTSATNEFQAGAIYFWDGTSVTYNRAVDIPEGAPYSLFSQKGVVYYFAGGRWWAISTGYPVPLFQMPGTDFEGTGLNTYMVNYPHMMTVRNNILLMGFPSDTNSTTMEHAVYSFGQRDKNYPNSMGYSYSISTLNRTYDGAHPLQIGMVKSFGDKLFIAWRDYVASADTYGVDLVDPNSNPYAVFTWESLINDFRFISIRRRFPRPDTDKQANKIRITFEALPTGVTITPKWKINRQSSWQNASGGTVTAVAGDTIIEININKRYKEIQFGFDGTATTVSPKITSVVLIAEMLPEEGD